MSSQVAAAVCRTVQRGDHTPRVPVRGRSREHGVLLEEPSGKRCPWLLRRGAELHALTTDVSPTHAATQHGGTKQSGPGSAGVLTPCCRLQHGYVLALLALIGIRFAHWHQSRPWDPSQKPFSLFLL